MKKLISTIVISAIAAVTAVASEPLTSPENDFRISITQSTYENMKKPLLGLEYKIIECEQEHTYAISNAYDAENDFVKTCLFEGEMLVEYDNSITNGIIYGFDLSFFSRELETSMCGPLMLMVFSPPDDSNEYYYHYYDTHWAPVLQKSGYSQTRPIFGTTEFADPRCRLAGIDGPTMSSESENEKTP